MPFQKKFYWQMAAILVAMAQAINAQAQLDSAAVSQALARGDSLLLCQEYPAARDAYREALKLDAGALPAWLGLGKIDLALENWAAAGDHFLQVLEHDQQHLEAHYFRGICTRETGKFKALLLRKMDWDKSQKHFRFVIQRDSLYRDVLWQYAQLLRYREDYQGAIQAAQAQVRLRPELIEPQVKLFRVYRYFITHTQLSEAIAWLERQAWEPARWAIAEKYRRDGNLAAAESLLTALLQQPLTMPRQPIYLSLAKILYLKKLPRQAEAYYWQAIREIDNDIAADLVFEDVKYIVTDEELAHYRSLTTIPDKQHFFVVLWTRRDPTPAAEVNVRLAEHYRRLCYAEKNFEYDGFRTWFNNPDTMGYLELTSAYRLNEEYNDKGLIYIRHGQHNDWAVTLNENSPANETWVYYRTPTTPAMTFHFALENTTQYWRFTPFITDPAMLEDRLHLGSIYYRMQRANPLEFRMYLEEMAQQSRRSVQAGLSTDRHTWDQPLKPLELPSSITTFRGSEGRTVIEIHYGFGLSSIMAESRGSDNPIVIERGVKIHNLNWNPVAHHQDQMQLPQQPTDSYLDLYRFEIPPDSYHVALHVRPLGTNLLGGWKLDCRIPNYHQPGLALSEVELATRIEPTSAKSKFAKNGLLVLPNPTHSFSLDKPVYIYFEIYQLRPDAAGKTSFLIDYSLTLRKASDGGLLRLFRGGKSTIGTRIEREGNSERSVEYLALDVSKLKRGEYELTIQVTDRHSGQSARQRRGLALE